MPLKEGYVAYVHKMKNGAVVVFPGKRTFHGPHEVYDPGFTAEFRGHLFTTNDPKIIEAMDGHSRYGVTFQRVKTPHDYELILKYGQAPVHMHRGPATTMAEKLGAARPVGPDFTRISEIAPPPPEPETPSQPARRPGRPRKTEG
jgi:hypothetical protein